MTSHVDAETLALAAEGLLDGDDDYSVRAHVAACRHCAEQQAALSDLTRLLGEAEPPPLPDSVAASLDEAIRAETERRRSETGPRPSLSSVPAASSTAPGGSEHPEGDGDPDDTATQLRRARDQAQASAPEGAQGADVVPMRPRRATRWMPYIAAAAAAVFVIGGGAAIMQGMSDDPTAEQPSADGGAAEDSGPHAIMPYRPLIAESGTAYTEAELAAQSAAVLQSAAPQLSGDDTEGSEGAQDDSEAGGLATVANAPAELAACIDGFSGGDTAGPQLVDVATYAPAGVDPAPAWVLYTPDASGDSYEVAVMDAGCSADDPEASVLTRVSVAAP